MIHFDDWILEAKSQEEIRRDYKQRLKDEGLIGKGSTKKGGVWDSLPSRKRGVPRNPDTILSKSRQKKEDERKARNKENLRKTIEDLYGPIPESVGTCSNWRKELYDC